MLLNLFQLYSVTTNRIAVLTHAVVWRWGTNFETGNLVPEGEVAPPGLHDSRMYVEAVIPPVWMLILFVCLANVWPTADVNTFIHLIQLWTIRYMNILL